MSEPRVKVGTVLDSEVLSRARALAFSRRRPLSMIFEDALRDYLARQEDTQASVALSTHGLLRSTPSHLHQVVSLDFYDE